MQVAGLFPPVPAAVTRSASLMRRGPLPSSRLESVSEAARGPSLRHLAMMVKSKLNPDGYL